MTVSATGFYIVNEISAQRKQYTAVLLSTGHLIKNYGGRDSGGAPVQGRSTVSLPVASTLALTSIYEEKFKGGEYSKLLIAFDTVELDLNGNESVAALEALAFRIVSQFRLKARVNGVGYNRVSFYNVKFPHNSGSVAAAAPVVNSKSLIDAAKAKFHTVVEPKILRPNGEQYHPREIMGHTDVALLRAFRKTKTYVRLAGPPGGGKTALAEACFNDLITVNGHGDMTVAHFVGNYLPAQGANASGWVWQDGPLVRAMKEGKTLFVDEGTRIPTEVLNILFSVMDGRGVLRVDDRPDLPEVKAHKDFYVIMGYNPETLGARALDEALVSRFRVQIEVKTDLTTAKRLKVPELAIKIARNLETRNRSDLISGGPGVWVPQMRELLTFRDLIKMNAGEDFALATLMASCPRQMDIENLRSAIEDVAKKRVSLPSLGGLV